MAEKKEDDKPPAAGGGGDGAPDKATIREVVAEALGDLFKGGKADVVENGGGSGGSGRGRGAERDVSGEVEAAVRRVQDKDSRDKAERDREARLAALEARLAKPEKEPRVLRRVTRLMWGGEDD